MEKSLITTEIIRSLEEVIIKEKKKNKKLKDEIALLRTMVNISSTLPFSGYTPDYMAFINGGNNNVSSQY